MGWNKEKVVLTLSIGVLLLVVSFAAPSWTGGQDPADLTITAPLKGGALPDVDAPLSWYVRGQDRLDAKVSSRNPFARVSDWAATTADPLPSPSAGLLARRTPLPAIMMDSRRALPIREMKLPTVQEEEGVEGNQ